MPPLTSLVLGIEGILGALNGAAKVLFPSIAAGTAKEMGNIPLPAVHAISLTGLALGYFPPFTFLSQIACIDRRWTADCVTPI
jgi:hypothetical protein